MVSSAETHDVRVVTTPASTGLLRKVLGLLCFSAASVSFTDQSSENICQGGLRTAVDGRPQESDLEQSDLQTCLSDIIEVFSNRNSIGESDATSGPLLPQMTSGMKSSPAWQQNEQQQLLHQKLKQHLQAGGAPSTPSRACPPCMKRLQFRKSASETEMHGMYTTAARRMEARRRTCHMLSTMAALAQALEYSSNSGCRTAATESTADSCGGLYWSHKALWDQAGCADLAGLELAGIELAGATVYDSDSDDPDGSVMRQVIQLLGGESMEEALAGIRARAAEDYPSGYSTFSGPPSDYEDFMWMGEQ